MTSLNWKKWCGKNGSWRLWKWRLWELKRLLPGGKSTSNSFIKLIKLTFRICTVPHPGPILQPLWAEMEAASGSMGVIIESLNTLSNRYYCIIYNMLIPGTVENKAAIAKADKQIDHIKIKEFPQRFSEETPNCSTIKDSGTTSVTLEFWSHDVILDPRVCLKMSQKSLLSTGSLSS